MRMLRVALPSTPSKSSQSSATMSRRPANPHIDYVSGERANPTNAPHYEGLDKVHLWSVVDKNPDILKYFPDKADRDRISRKWLIDVSIANTIFPILLTLHRHHADAPHPEGPRIRGARPGHDQKAQGGSREERQPPRQHEAGVRGEAEGDPAAGHGKCHPIFEFIKAVRHCHRE